MTVFDAPLVYEIAFDVPPDRRETFQDWLSSAVVEWVSHERIAYFEVFQSDSDESPAVKFVFGFDTRGDWERFVGGDDHETALERLETSAENRETVLWHRTSIKLDETTDATYGGGRHGELPEFAI